MLVYDTVENVVLNLNTSQCVKAGKNESGLGYINFVFQDYSGYNIFFPNYHTAKHVFNLMMVSLQTGSSVFLIDNSLKNTDMELPFT